MKKRRRLIMKKRRLTCVALAMMIGFFSSGYAVHAAEEIVHDAEYYILGSNTLKNGPKRTRS